LQPDHLSGDILSHFTFTPTTYHAAPLSNPLNVYRLILQAIMSLSETSQRFPADQRFLVSRSVRRHYSFQQCQIFTCVLLTMTRMENWGLITYRTTALLFDEKSSDIKYKNRIAYVVAHELAHQYVEIALDQCCVSFAMLTCNTTGGLGTL